LPLDTDVVPDLVHLTNRNVYGLILVVTIAWVLILVESYLFIAVIRPLGPPLHGGLIPSSVLKVLLTACLGGVWVAVMFAMDAVYFRWKRTPTSAS
jgi:hypothetical protein